MRRKNIRRIDPRYFLNEMMEEGDPRSDPELKRAAKEAGIEDLVTIDGAGDIENRDEVIALLKDAWHSNQTKSRESKKY